MRLSEMMSDAKGRSQMNTIKHCIDVHMVNGALLCLMFVDGESA